MNGLVKLNHLLYQNMQQWQYWDEISLFTLLMIFPYYFSVSINIHENANDANKITCILTMKLKTLVLAFTQYKF